MVETLVLTRRSPWDGALSGGRHGRTGAPHGVGIAPRLNLETCTVLARSGAEAVVAGLLADHFLTEPLAPGQSHAWSDGRIAWDGPAQWRVIRAATGGGGNGSSGELAREMATLFSATASVIDQSHGFATVQISGPMSPMVLAKGSSLDCSPDRFPPGKCALTTFAHVAVHVTRLEDASLGGSETTAPVFDLQLFRSMAGSFAHWLMSSSLQYGVEVAD